MWCLWLGVAILLALSTGTVDSTDDEQENRFGFSQESITARSNYFDAELLKRIGTAESGNFVISPASIKLLLALLIEGAEGSTLDELLSVLRLPANIDDARNVLSTLQTALQKSTSTKVTVDSASRIFVSKSVTPNNSFKSAIKRYYQTDVSSEDFSLPATVVKSVNDWANTRTNGLISKLMENGKVTSETMSVIANVVYFDGKWKNEFKAEDTEVECFFAEPNFECQNTKMMSKTEELFYTYDPTLDAHIVQIPYQDTRFSMVIVMPYKKDGMKQLTLDANRLSFPEIVQKLKSYEVNLKMPSYTIEYGAEIIDTLKKMGLYELFSDNAKLSKMFKGKVGKVGAVVHKAKIEVNEKGTKAAASTGASVVPLSFASEVVNLQINHPFYYFVHEKDSHGVLFAGRLSSIPGAPQHTVPHHAHSPGELYTDPDDIEAMVADTVRDHDATSNKPSSKGPENRPYNQHLVPPKRNNHDSLLLS